MLKALFYIEERSGVMSTYQKKERAYIKNMSYNKGNRKIPISHTGIRRVKNPFVKFYLLLFFTFIIMAICILLSTQYTYGGNSLDLSLSEEKDIICTGFKSVLIVKGDNLNILANKYFNGKDLNRQKYVDRFIKDTIQVNNLDKSGKIYAGGYLLLPQYN